MSLLRDLRARCRQAGWPLLGVLLVIYAAYHVVQGDRGLIAWWRAQNAVTAAKENLTRLDAEAAKLSHRVSLLRLDSLDPDLLDERARFMLHYGYADEIVVFDHADYGKADDGRLGAFLKAAVPAAN